ncbi:RNA-binding protein RO60 [Aphomia sociella]
MSNPTLNPVLKNRLTRFIHTGNEFPSYFPGCWTSHKYFEADKLPSVTQALANGAKNLEVIEVILQAYKDGYYTRFETIAFALSKCLLVGSPPIKEATYKAAAEICKTPEQMMLFNKFVRLLKTGNGRGWCKNVKDWYLKKDPMELAKEMTRVRARHGRSHKTLLRKSHVKIPANDHARDAVIKYAIFGFKRAKQLLNDVEGTKEVLDYIQIVDELRHCEDPIAASVLAEENKFSLDHVPGHLLTSQPIWNAILPQFSLRELLYNIQRIHNMGFLTKDSVTTLTIIKMLNNQELIKNSNVTPIEVYITMNNYKRKSRPLKYEKAKVALEKEQRRRTRQTLNPNTGLWEWNATKRHPKEVKHWGIDLPPNQDVLCALNNLIDKTWLLMPPTKARYMITMDMRHHMFKGRHFCKKFSVPLKSKRAKAKKAPSTSGDADTEKKSKRRLHAECFYNKHISPGYAAIIMALHILKREEDVKLAVFTDDGVQIVSLERNFCNIQEAEFVLRKANLGTVQLDAPIECAIKANMQVDVFINMVDRTTRYMELQHEARGGRGPGGRYGPPPPEGVRDRCPARALLRYREQAGLPNAKLIVMSLASHRVSTTDGTHEGILDIIGIDEHVPKVIDAFVLGQFK